MIILGQKVKDTITGFEGIATGRSTFLNGCDRICVQPKVDKEGKLPEPQWFDEPQLKVVGGKKTGRKNADKGGPMLSIPTRNNYK